MPKANCHHIPARDGASRTAVTSDMFSVTVSNDATATFPIGVTTVTWTATDANGNSATATQWVTVNLIDTVAPVITVPADVSVSTSTSQATVDIGIASATDNVDGIVAVTNDAPATFPIGVTTVTYTSTDLAGNTATATQNIYVSYSSTIGGGSGGGTTTPPPTGGGATVASEAVYWHHNDHLGTPQALTDINGTKVWEMSQTPFGIATVNEDPDGDGLTVTNNFRFPGQYFDAETGLNYNYFRTFDPTLGRYIQSDPIGLNGGMNTFGYVENNPINLFDSEGLFAVTAGGSVRLPSWLKYVIPDFIGQGGSAGVAIQLTDNCGNFSPDLGLYWNIQGGGQDFGVGRFAVNLGFSMGEIGDLAGRGADVSDHYGMYGVTANFQETATGNQFGGATFDIGLGYNIGTSGSVGASWSIGGGLQTQ